MLTAERRAAISAYLQQAEAPVSASALAAKFAVSRQIIVGDIAVLRASGQDITATPRGYVITSAPTGILRTVACRHSSKELETELQTIVDMGCSVLDVIVEHPVYGQISGRLDLSSRYDIQQFMHRCGSVSAHPLSGLTNGIHLHTLSCPDEQAYQHVCEALDKLGILLKDE
ncbi:MAG: transcription repressor NadR [Oscillospiraceae bacterium]|nr:transcription repressor NadR [Oscillospiraceae bacterium]